jgi:hypothetical protein
MRLWNVGLLRDYTALHPKTLQSHTGSNENLNSRQDWLRTIFNLQIQRSHKSEDQHQQLDHRENTKPDSCFWDVAPCNLVQVERRFRDAYCLHQLSNVSHLTRDNTVQYPRRLLFTLAAVRTWNLADSPMFILHFVMEEGRGPGSSVSILSGYEVDDRAIEVRSPAEAKDIPLASVSRPSLGPTGGPFPGGKVRPGRDADHSPHLVPRSRISRSYTSSPPKRNHGV